TWLLLRELEVGGERNRGLYVIKSRGMSHSNQVREFVLTSNGVKLQDVYVGPEGALTGSRRIAQEARERARLRTRRQTIERKQRAIDRGRAAAEAQIAALRVELDAAAAEATLIAAQDEARERTLVTDRDAMFARRGGSKKGKGNRR